MTTSSLPAILALLLAASAATIERPAAPARPGVAVASAVRDPARPRRHPLYRSSDSGRTWTPAPGDLPDGMQVSFLETLGNQLVTATESHGIFLGDPKRGDWAPPSAGLPGKKITALHVAEASLYVGVYEKGIFESPDRGRSWRSLNRNLADLRVRAIMTVEGALLVGTDSGIFIRRSGRSRWEKVFAEGQFVSFNRSGRRIVGGGARGTALSEDGGESWRWILTEGAAHNTALVGGRIVVMNISGELLGSDDWGQSWSRSSYEPRQASYVYEIVGLGETLIASNNYGIHRSDDGGAHWRLVHPTEDMIFIDLLSMDGLVYGGTRAWRERRPRSTSPAKR